MNLREVIIYYHGYSHRLKPYLIIKMLQQQRLSGRDCRNPDHKDVFGARHPWHLDLGNPPAFPDRGRLCRDDDFDYAD
ncbi:MAG: hypothetical protein KGZ88_20650 [Methylomicrobium sp.]|nr:hypothetical protein [Methylomicrobium sp.]